MRGLLRNITDKVFVELPGSAEKLRSVFGNPAQDDVRVQIAASAIPSTPISRRHTTSPARAKLSCTFASWHEGEGPDFVNVAASEGIVAGSIEKGEFLCILSKANGVDCRAGGS